MGERARRELRGARFDAELRRTDVQGPDLLERGSAGRVDVHAVVEDVVEAAVVRHYAGRVAHDHGARRHGPADYRAGADHDVVADGDAPDDYRMRPDEDPVADGRCAAPFGAAGDADGDVLRQAAVMADAGVRGEDDRAVVPDVEPVADLALRRDADAGGHLHQLLRHRGDGAR